MDFVFKYIPLLPKGGRRGIYLETKSIIIKPDESYLSFLMIPKSERSLFFLFYFFFLHLFCLGLFLFGLVLTETFIS